MISWFLSWYFPAPQQKASRDGPRWAVRHRHESLTGLGPLQYFRQRLSFITGHFRHPGRGHRQKGAIRLPENLLGGASPIRIQDSFTSRRHHEYRIRREALRGQR